LIAPFQIDDVIPAQAGIQSPPDLTIRIHLDPAPQELGLTAAGEYEGNWRLFRRKDGWRLEVLDPLTHLQVKQVALISNEFNQIQLHLIPLEHLVHLVPSGWGLGEVMDPLLKWWLTGWLALRRQGLIFHGSAVVRERSSLAFIGPSGAGKTTLARLCLDQKESGWTVLNDERILIWEETDGWQVSSTPWPGMLGKISPASALLGGLFTLSKASENRMVPLPPQEFLTQLISEAFHPIWSREAMEGLLAAAGRLVEQVPNGAFQFRNDSSAVSFLEGFLQRSCAPSLSISP
jgi:hypothetical protein